MKRTGNTNPNEKYEATNKYENYSDEINKELEKKNHKTEKYKCYDNIQCKTRKQISQRKEAGRDQERNSSENI